VHHCLPVPVEDAEIGNCLPLFVGILAQSDLYLEDFRAVASAHAARPPRDMPSQIRGRFMNPSPLSVLLLCLQLPLYQTGVPWVALRAPLRGEIQGGGKRRHGRPPLVPVTRGPQNRDLRCRSHMASSPVPMGSQKAISRKSSVAATTVLEGTPRLA